MADSFYRSVIDPKMLTVARVTTAASVVGLGLVAWSGLSASALFVIPALLAAATLPWWILSTTNYTLTDRTLEIRSGPFHWSVALSEITRIETTRSSVASAALSLDRLRIQHHAGSQVLISPENRREFLADLRRRGVRVEVG